MMLSMTSPRCLRTVRPPFSSPCSLVLWHCRVGLWELAAEHSDLLSYLPGTLARPLACLFFALVCGEVGGCLPVCEELRVPRHRVAKEYFRQMARTSVMHLQTEHEPGSTCALVLLVCVEAAHLWVAALHPAVPVFRDELPFPLPAVWY